MKINNLAKLIIAIAVSESAGIIGSVFTIPSIATWYAGLVKPEFAPPNWVFAPVWTILFALMGVAAFLVWSSCAKASDDKKKGIKVSLFLFGIQLVLNTLWSIIFFGLHNPGAAFVEIIFLWLAILATIIAFAKTSSPASGIRTSEGRGKLAAWLLVPYIFWVSFAAYLNYAIWILN